MAGNPKKESLRRVLLERRDSISHEMMKIASTRILNKLKMIGEFKDARTVACYYPTGSEVLTQDIMLEGLSCGREICLPKVVGSSLEFRRITDLDCLERRGGGGFDIMEPKDDCPRCDSFDIVIVPAVGLSRDGARLGYGYGYYDRFLAGQRTVSVALSYAKQMVGSIPTSSGDVPVDWIVTEDEFFKAS